MTELEQLKNDLIKIQERINKLETPTLEVGKWYKDIYSECIFNYVSDNNSYGIQHGVWVSNCWIVTGERVNWKTRPATDKEVEEALIKEAEKRGFKEGVRCHSFIHNRPLTIHGNEKEYLGGRLNKLHYGVDGNSYVVVFEHGKWAEIIKDEPIKIGGYEVKKESGGFKIGCKTISSHFLRCLQIEMTENKFKTVSFDGIETDLETINKILTL